MLVCIRRLRRRETAAVAKLVEALREFKRPYNKRRLIERHGLRASSQVRRASLSTTLSVA